MAMKDAFVQAVLVNLDETFENVHGIFLDRGTSIFETLATVTAEEASQPVSANCASLAAHVEHMRFYIEMSMEYAQGRDPGKLDWGHIWRTVREVTPEEWANSIQRLREAYQQLVAMLKATTDLENEDVLASIMGILAHNAYHLGEIRQALCTLKE